MKLSENEKEKIIQLKKPVTMYSFYEAGIEPKAGDPQFTMLKK